MRTVLLRVLALNAIVVMVKLYVGLRTGALTVLGASLESGLDLLNNVIALTVVRVAAQEPDEDHPYGHDKFETLGALSVVGFLSISCFELLREGVAAFMHGGMSPHVGRIDVGILVATLFINAFIVWYENARGKQLGSALLVADAAHTRGDLFVTFLALLSLGTARFLEGRLDAVLAVLVALVIAWSGWQILRASIPVLVDERAVEAAELRRIVSTVPEVREVRSVRSRFTSSGLLFAEVTIAVRHDVTVKEAHDLSDAVEAVIERELGAAQVTVHVEPA
ncbi:MAG: cation diffusion facilitator family transporter [Gemmatimonadetes bacterium]|nr:cation diffusion facilitator family transporter [Gemmatimonadota bacterium]